MPNIPFTQYLRPDGRTTPVTIDRPEPVADKAKRIIDRGFRFDIEQLTTGDISMTISDDLGDYAQRICPNGPAVPVSVDEMILGFDIAEALAQRQRNYDEEE